MESDELAGQVAWDVSPAFIGSAGKDADGGRGWLMI